MRLRSGSFRRAVVGPLPAEASRNNVSLVTGRSRQSASIFMYVYERDAKGFRFYVDSGRLRSRSGWKKRESDGQIDFGKGLKALTLKIELCSKLCIFEYCIFDLMIERYYSFFIYVDIN